jgi:SAM-dependent methyltransferase
MTELVKEETKRQWNVDFCGGERGEGNEAGSLAYYLAIEKDRYESYAPWIRPTIGFERYSGPRILEVGGGLGTDLAQFARAGGLVTDCDLATGHLEMARRNFAVRGLPGDFLLGDGEVLPFRDGTFDVVYSFGVVHHTPDTEGAIDEFHRVLRPGGEAIVMVYAKHSWNYWVRDWWMLGIRRGMLRTGTMADILSENTEYSPSGARPLVKVYTARECRRLFAKFREVSICKRQLTSYEIPRALRAVASAEAWGRWMGWNLVVRAIK